MMRRKVRLVVDPVACEGRGPCCELLPEWIKPDPWGFPVIPDGSVPERFLGLAQMAVAECPRMALHLVQCPS
jgi:ferredoxin